MCFEWRTTLRQDLHHNSSMVSLAYGERVPQRNMNRVDPWGVRWNWMSHLRRNSQRILGGTGHDVPILVLDIENVPVQY